jgi:outer membrane protein assembly factor BamD
MLGQTYEKAAEAMRKSKASQSQKERLDAEFVAKAAEAYSRIITRYPVGDRAEEAKKRLLALNKPVPVPTEAAIALNRSEVKSRVSAPFIARVTDTFSSRPALAEKVATRVGEPSITDASPASAVTVTQHTLSVMNGGSSTTAIERVTGTSTPEPVPATTTTTNPTPAVIGTPAPLKLEEVSEAGANTNDSSSATSANSSANSSVGTNAAVPTSSNGTGTANTQPANTGSQTETVPPPLNQVNQLGDNSNLTPEDNPNAAQNTNTKDSSSKKKKHKFRIF